MKQVFTNDQLCHVWAQGTQASGRSDSMFFEGNKIYSYGKHYLAAEIHTSKSGKRIALVNSHKYSVTTSKHLSSIRNALVGLMEYFECPDPNDLKSAVKSFDNQALQTLLSTLKVSKVNSVSDLQFRERQISAAYGDVNCLRDFLGMVNIKPNKIMLNKAKKHLKSRLARYQELNTPEMIAKKELEKQKRDVLKVKKLQGELAESIQKFRDSKPFSQYYRLNELEYELLRIHNDILQTSRGAEVPLRAAKMLYKAVVAGKSILGAKVGNFTVVSVKDLGDDKAIKIGCHTILLSEAKQVLGNV